MAWVVTIAAVLTAIATGLSAAIAVMRWQREMKQGGFESEVRKEMDQMARAASRSGEAKFKIRTRIEEEAACRLRSGIDPRVKHVEIWDGGCRVESSSR